MSEKNVPKDGEVRVLLSQELTFAREGIGKLVAGAAKAELLKMDAEGATVRVVLKDGRTKTLTFTGSDIFKAMLPEIRTAGKIASLKKKNPDWFETYSGKGKAAETDGDDW